jgi:RecG-like helicase
MDFALNGIVNWLYTQVAALLSFVSTSFLTTMGCTLKTFDTYFPFAKDAYTVIQGFAFGLLLLIFLFQVFKNYLGPMTDAENPVFLLIKTCIFMVPVLAAKNLYEWMLDIVGTPYNALMGMGTDVNTVGSALQWKSIGDSITNSAGGGIIGMIIALIILIVIGWNFFKLVLEAAERYIIIGVLAYLAPLPVCTGASKATKKAEIICSTNDGFEIARRDLEMHGPGQYIGTKQSGQNKRIMLSIAYPELFRDMCSAWVKTRK